MSKGVICFLDIDGVLTSGRATFACGERGIMKRFDPLACEFLERHCVENDLQIVISSYWRMGTDENYWRDLFYCAGYRGIRIYRDTDQFKTPELPGVRGNEIKFWLNVNGDHDYIILDDSSDMLDEQKPWFVHTDINDGICARHYAQFNRLMAGFREDWEEEEKWQRIHDQMVFEKRAGKGSQGDRHLVDAGESE